MDPYEASRTDIALAVVFCLSGLLGFCLSFTLLASDARPVLFSACIGVCLVCLLFATNKKGVLLGFGLFLLTGSHGLGRKCDKEDGCTRRSEFADL